MAMEKSRKGHCCHPSAYWLENRLHPTPPLTGQDGTVAHCSMYPGD